MGYVLVGKIFKGFGIYFEMTGGWGSMEVNRGNRCTIASWNHFLARAVFFDLLNDMDVSKDSKVVISSGEWECNTFIDVELFVCIFSDSFIWFRINTLVVKSQYKTILWLLLYFTTNYWYVLMLNCSYLLVTFSKCLLLISNGRSINVKLNFGMSTNI